MSALVKPAMPVMSAFRHLLLLMSLLCIAVAGAAAADPKQEAMDSLLKSYNADGGDIEQLLQLRYAVNDAILNAALAGVEGAPLPTLGDSDGLTIYEFSDYQCGFCRRMFPLIAEAVDSGKAKFALIELPVLGPLSDRAARVALAAQQQGKYDAFHRALMKNSGRLSERKIDDAIETAGLSKIEMESYIQSDEVEAQLESNYKLAILLEVNGTPAFIINGQIYSGALEEDVFKRLIEEGQE